MNPWLPTWGSALLLFVTIGIAIQVEHRASLEADCPSFLSTTGASVPIVVGTTPVTARGLRVSGAWFVPSVLYLIGSSERVPSPQRYLTRTLVGPGSVSFMRPSFNNASERVAA